MTNFVRIALASVCLAAAFAAPAGDFDGSKQLICAPVEAIACVPGTPCSRGEPDEIGAPAFLRIDVAGKKVVGTQRTSPIASVEATDAQLLLQGSELGFGWAIALDQASGRMTATLADREGAFILFGACMPL